VMNETRLKTRTGLSAIRRSLPPATSFLLFTFYFLLFPACQSQPKEKTASVDALTAPLSTPVPAPSVDPRITDLERIKEGTAAPDFALEDINSNTVRLSDYKGKKNVILVFYRGYF